MNEITLKQLKESNYYHPEVTEVIFEANQMFEMSLHSVSISEKGYDIVWDTLLLLISIFLHKEDSTWKYRYDHE